MFAAELLRGITAGTAGIGIAKGVVAVGSKVSMAVSSGRISSLFCGMQQSIMRPMLGPESGLLNWGIKVLQTGGRIVEEHTSKAPNNALGRNLNKREWGKALERLKKSLNLRNDHHGKILSNGDYLDTNGRNLGNLTDY